MWADQINKNKLKQRHGATQGQPPLRTASALASDKLLSVLREIYTDWSRAIAHHPSHAVWDKPLFQTHTNTANWKGHYCGFSSRRRGKGTILSNWLFDRFMCSYLTPFNNYNVTVDGTLTSHVQYVETTHYCTTHYY